MSTDVALANRGCAAVVLPGLHKTQVTFTRGGLSWTVPIVVVVGQLEVIVVPSIMISANLPDGIRGYPYTGTISAMNIGGAIGAISITVDELPAGLSLGATTTADGITYTATLTGTLQ
jgi:hypothetical protein